jgi:ribosome-binding protein aMBF1 (putative translation factor)
MTKNKTKKEEYHCEICGRKITKEEYAAYDGMCWECWDDQLTEESEDLFGDVM